MNTDIMAYDAAYLVSMLTFLYISLSDILLISLFSGILVTKCFLFLLET